MEEGCCSVNFADGGCGADGDDADAAVISVFRADWAVVIAVLIFRALGLPRSARRRK
jgi:hypothetical protein